MQKKLELKLYSLNHQKSSLRKNFVKRDNRFEGKNKVRKLCQIKKDNCFQTKKKGELLPFPARNIYKEKLLTNIISVYVSSTSNQSNLKRWNRRILTGEYMA